MEETGLHTEPFAAEREWQIEGIPVLSASILVPDPGPEKDRKSTRLNSSH